MSTGKVADGLAEGSACIVFWLGPGERLAGGGVNKHSEVLGVISSRSVFQDKSGVAVLDDTNYLWNKDVNKRLFLEVDASDTGWGACAFQYEHKFEGNPEDEGRGRLTDLKAKRNVIEYIGKAWTTDELKLPVFYREVIARLKALEKFRNLIETSVESGITCLTDHEPASSRTASATKGNSANGALLKWRI